MQSAVIGEVSARRNARHVACTTGPPCRRRRPKMSDLPAKLAKLEAKAREEIYTAPITKSPIADMLCEIHTKHGPALVEALTFAQNFAQVVELWDLDDGEPDSRAKLAEGRHLLFEAATKALAAMERDVDQALKEAEDG